MHLQRDNGQQFIPLSINTPWFQYGKKNSNGHQWSDGTYGLDIMYQQFVANGLNFFHLWTCNWNLGRDTPFARPNIGCDGNSTTTFSTYQDTSQVTTSNAQLRVLGRKNATFAMFYVQNTTRTWGAGILIDVEKVPVLLLDVVPTTRAR